MFKKIIFIILIILSLKVNAKQIEDKVTIKHMDVKIAFLDKNKYLAQNSYDVLTIFGVTPNERYFYKLLRKDEADYDTLQVTANTNYGHNIVEEGLLVFIGEETKLLNENQEINISFVTALENEKSNFYNITDEKYDIEKVDFEIIYSEPLTDKVVLFSLDNKEYKEKIEGLDFSIEKDILLKGTYTKKIDTENNLSFKVVDKNDISKTSFLKNLIVIISILIVIFVVLILLIKKYKLTKEQKNV